MGIVYCVTNKQNGKLYIGSTIQTLVQRKSNHITSSRKGSNYYFHKALRKYGIDNFSWRIIDTSETEEKLIELEMFYIDFFGSYLTGYNSDLKERGVGCWSGKSRSNETRKKISNSLKGKPLSEETKKKISESLRGSRNFNFGRIRSREQRQHLSILLKGRKLSDNTKRKMSESRQGEKHPMFGKHHSEESKQKIRDSLKAYQILRTK